MPESSHEPTDEIVLSRSSPLAQLAAAAAIVLTTVGFGAVMIVGWRSDPAEPTTIDVPTETAEKPAPTAPPSPARATAAGRLAGWRVDAFEPLAPALSAQTRLIERFDPGAPYTAVDSVLLEGTEKRIRLADATGVGRNEICRYFSGALHACGLEARATLQNFLTDKTVACDPLFIDDERVEGVVSARCRAGGRDLAMMMIEAGFAFPSPLAGKDHRDAEARARSEKRGVWSGPWTIPSVDPSIADDAAHAFGSLRPFGSSPPPRPDQP